MIPSVNRKQDAGDRMQEERKTENGERRTENGERRNGKRRNGKNLASTINPNDKIYLIVD
jgi:hypothetical protein